MNVKIKKKLTVYLCGVLMVSAGVVGGLLSDKASEKDRVAIETAAQSLPKHPVIVLDAGHGGMDGGCVADDGTPEKGINLNIMLSTRDILTVLGYDVRCTRETDISIHDKGVEGVAAQKRSDMDNRLAIINGCGASLALSIHQNRFTDGKYYGAQMFYKVDDAESSRLADTLRERFRAELQPENERETKPVGSELFLIHNAECPAVMVECGFLSNPDEAKLLCSEQYQREVAFTVADSVNRYLSASEHSDDSDNTDASSSDDTSSAEASTDELENAS